MRGPREVLNFANRYTRPTAPKRRSRGAEGDAGEGPELPADRPDPRDRPEHGVPPLAGWDHSTKWQERRSEIPEWRIDTTIRAETHGIGAMGLGANNVHLVSNPEPLGVGPSPSANCLIWAHVLVD